jgi:hypothetical protein
MTDLTRRNLIDAAATIAAASVAVVALAAAVQAALARAPWPGVRCQRLASSGSVG